jgi:peptide/nickel transport system substrate-binding protein
MEPQQTPPSEPVQQPTEAPIINQDLQPESEALPPAPEPKKKSGTRKWLLLIFLLLILVGGGYLAHHYTQKSSKTITSTKDISLVRIGSANGPVGTANIYPNPQGTYLSLAISSQIYEGLVSYNDNKIVPDLATSWTNPDTSTWVFQIAQNIKFQNGDSLTTADVVNSFEANIKNSGWNKYTSTIDTVKSTGEHQVTITTTTPDALLLKRLVSAFVFKKTSDGTLYGTGPYVVDKSKPDTDASLNLKAFEGYHAGSPKTKALSYAIYESPEQLVAAYKANKIDSFDDYVNAATQKQLSSTAQVAKYADAGSSMLLMNMVRPAGVLANKTLREAIAYALDRPSLVKQSANAAQIAQTLIPQSVIGYAASVTFPGLDVAKSKQLQTAAGYPNGAPLTFVYVKDAQPDPPVIIQQLQAAGFKVIPTVVSSSHDLFTVTKTGNFDLMGLTYSSDYFDATDIFTAMLDSRQSDFQLYDNTKYNALIDTAEQTFNAAQHIQKVQAINKFITDNYLAIPVHSTETALYFRPNYQIPKQYTRALATPAYWRVGQTVTTQE